MTKLRLPLVVIVSVCISVVLSAQQGQASSSSGGGSLSIEELYLTQEVQIQILRSQALSNTRESKLLALQNIRSMIQDKTATGDTKEVVTILEALAGEGVYRTTRQNGEVINDFPDIRRQAVETLGDLGGAAVKPILQKVLIEDKEPMVLSEAVYAMGKVATKDDKDVLPYIAKTLVRNNTRIAPDNNLAFACMLAIEKISEKTGGVGDPDIVNALLDIASGSYLRDVRLKAFSVLTKIRVTK